MITLLPFKYSYLLSFYLKLKNTEIFFIFLFEYMLTTQEGINYLRGYLSTCDRCILGVAGGSASGKSYLVDELHRVVNDSKILQMDDYYKGSSVILREKKIKGDSNDVNFDEPSAIDIDLLVEHLSLLKNGLKIKKPIYNFKRHERCDAEDYEPSKVIF